MSDPASAIATMVGFIFYWPYATILIAGWLATDIWRFFGVLLGERIDENGEIFLWIRAVATALVAGIVGHLILFPSGVLATTPVEIRVMALATGFIIYLIAGKNILIGILAAEAALFCGWWLTGTPL